MMMSKCDHCQNRIIASPKVLTDGSRLCFKCFLRIPNSIIPFAKVNWNYHDYANWIEYEENHKNDASLFKSTFMYGDLSIDEEHMLYKVAGREVFPIRMISQYELFYKDVEIQNVMFKKKAFGRSFVIIDSLLPKCRFEVKLSDNASADVYMENGTYMHGYPAKVLHLKRILDTCFVKMEEERRAKEAEYRKKYQQKSQQKQEYNKKQERSQKKERPVNSTSDDVNKALNLFMLSSLDGIDEQKLRHIRNGLIKAFHSDNGELDSTQSQRINEAYEILKGALHA